MNDVNEKVIACASCLQDMNDEALSHYGRQGMKWYQHIYGPVQSVAQYAKRAKEKIGEKSKAHLETKKEKMIRKGDVKGIYKNRDKFTDEELRRADDRIKKTSNLERSLGVNPDQNASNFANQQKNIDPVKAFINTANTISSVYDATEKLVKVYDSAQKYTTAGKEKAALKKDILDNLNADAYRKNPGLLNTKEKEELKRGLKADKEIEDIMRGKYRSDEAFGPNPNPSSYGKGSSKGPSKKDMTKWLDENFSDYYDEWKRNNGGGD